MSVLAIRVLTVVLLATTAWRVHALRAYFGSQEADGTQVAALQARLDAIPLVLDDGAFTGASEFETDEVIGRSGAHAYIARTYTSKRGSTRLYVGSAQFLTGYFHAPRGCLPAHGWEIVEDAAVPFDAYPVATDEPRMRRLLAQQGFERMLIHYWFQSADRVGAEVGSTHVFRFLDLLQNQPVRPVHIVTIYTQVYGDGGLDEASSEAKRFIQAVSPHLREALE